MISDQYITSQSKTINYLLLIITIVCIVAVSLGIYLRGGLLYEIPSKIFGIISYYVYGLLMSKISFYLIRFSGRKYLAYIPLIVMSNPIFDAVTFFWVDKYVNAEIFYSFILPISVIFEVIAMLILFQQVKANPQAFSLSRVENISRAPSQSQRDDSASRIVYNSNDALGQGTTTLDRIIRSLMQRAEGYKKNILATMLAILVIVGIGISFSVGMTAYSEVKKVRELERTRVELINITDKFKSSDTTNLVKLKTDIQKIIKQNYGDEKGYQQIIQNIEKQTVVSWPDIAMRVTIAALTLFLVQVFFNIYKYNQQQVSNLVTRAETLELYKETGANQEELRSGLLNKLDTSPSFDKTPSSPADQIINVITKSKEE